eukprot:4659071-Pleurochrysis_carterae.AAC.3
MQKIRVWDTPPPAHTCPISIKPGVVGQKDAHKRKQNRVFGLMGHGSWVGTMKEGEDEERGGTEKVAKRTRARVRRTTKGQATQVRMQSGMKRAKPNANSNIRRPCITGQFYGYYLFHMHIHSIIYPTDNISVDSTMAMGQCNK